MSGNNALARLRGADWLATAKPFFDCLEGDEGGTRAVGGIVRDTLLGIERGKTDIDLATQLLPDEVIARAQASAITAHPTGIEHGTVTLVANGVVAEVTTLREDIETFGRKAKVRFGTDWVRDAERRDFTMNALYARADGTLFDPLGGLDDCLAHRVRFIGDPDSRIAEDRLRVFRYFRFVASHGRQDFDPEALKACARVAGKLDALSAERVGAEMMRLFELAEIAATVGQMVRLGILGADLVPKTALMAFARIETMDRPPTAPMRLAVLTGCGVVLKELQKRWRLSNAILNETEAIVAAGDLALEQDWYALAYFYPRHARNGIEVAAAVGQRDDHWRAASVAAIEASAPGQFPVTGTDLIELGFTPGPALGSALKRLERMWVDGGFQIEKQALLDRARLLK